MHTSILAVLRPRLLAALCLWALTLFSLAAPGYAAGPVVSGAGLSPATLPVTGGMITVTATVTSALALTSVKAYIYRDGVYTSFSVTMSNGGSGNVYTGTFGASDINTTSADYAYTCGVTATDSSNQSNTTLTGKTTQAHDNAPPTITVTSLTPATLPVTGGVMTVKATVTDPGSRAISSVKAFIYKDGAYISFSATMSNGGSGNVYTGTFGASGSNTTSADTVYSVVITATNDLNLSNSANVGQTVQAHDNAPPVFTATSLSPATVPYTGAGITVSATVTDPGSRPITEVKAFLYRDGAYVSLSAILSNGGSGNVYSGNFASGTNSTNAAYTFTVAVQATDDLGLASTVNVAGKSVQGYNGPTPSLIPFLYTTEPTAPVLSPANVAAGGPDLSLKINGANFGNGAVVLFNGFTLTPTSNSGTQITVTVPAVQITHAGSYAVCVVNSSLSSPSNSVNLIVTSAAHSKILWTNPNGQAAVWSVDAKNAYTSKTYGPFAGWTAKAASEGPDGITHILWTHSPDGQVSLWDVTDSGYSSVLYGPFSGWTVLGLDSGP